MPWSSVTDLWHYDEGDPHRWLCGEAIAGSPVTAEEPSGTVCAICHRLRILRRGDPPECPECGCMWTGWLGLTSAWVCVDCGTRGTYAGSTSANDSAAAVAQSRDGSAGSS